VGTNGADENKTQHPRPRPSPAHGRARSRSAESRRMWLEVASNLSIYSIRLWQPRAKGTVQKEHGIRLGYTGLVGDTQGRTHGSDDSGLFQTEDDLGPEKTGYRITSPGWMEMDTGGRGTSRRFAVLCPGIFRSSTVCSRLVKLRASLLRFGPWYPYSHYFGRMGEKQSGAKPERGSSLVGLSFPFRGQARVFRAITLGARRGLRPPKSTTWGKLDARAPATRTRGKRPPTPECGSPSDPARSPSALLLGSRLSRFRFSLAADALQDCRGLRELPPQTHRGHFPHSPRLRCLWAKQKLNTM